MNNYLNGIRKYIKFDQESQNCWTVRAIIGSNSLLVDPGANLNLRHESFKPEYYTRFPEQYQRLAPYTSSDLRELAEGWLP